MALMFIFLMIRIFADALFLSTQEISEKGLTELLL